MLTKNLRVVYFSCLILHLLLSIYYSILMPWGGDEWYTYSDSWSPIIAVQNTVKRS